MKNLFWLLAVAVLFTACTEADKARNEALDKVHNRNYYIPQNAVEFNNYNRRQKIADDPTTILWCTIFPPHPGQEPVTVPIVGKLTSGGKRPYSSEPAPDGMYGSSGEYRYGFTPADVYVDIYSLSSICMTEPTVWQRNNTVVSIEIDEELQSLNKNAREALQGGDIERAYEILKGVEGK